jgi:hypothetical protein
LRIPTAVIESDAFLADAEAFFTEDERAELVLYIAMNPDAGVIMPETGGVRKLRWGVKGRGKSGGVRVIYYFHDETLPVFMLNVFAKNEKANLSKAERNALRRYIPVMIAAYRSKK